MLEQTLNSPWERLISTQLFEPLNLRTARFDSPYHEERIFESLNHLLPEEVAHTHDGSSQINNSTVLGPAGGVHMSLDDLPDLPVRPP